MVGMVAEVEEGRWPTHVSGEWTVEMLDALPEGTGGAETFTLTTPLAITLAADQLITI